MQSHFVISLFGMGFMTQSPLPANPNNERLFFFKISVQSDFKQITTNFHFDLLNKRSITITKVRCGFRISIWNPTPGRIEIQMTLKGQY